uniref:Secreted protein n=1 Tax=Knipowitschia caucasica TaxID=637954 RepID=A0AAV2MIA5_KNICA
MGREGLRALVWVPCLSGGPSHAPSQALHGSRRPLLQRGSPSPSDRACNRGDTHPCPLSSFRPFFLPGPHAHHLWPLPLSSPVVVEWEVQQAY